MRSEVRGDPTHEPVFKALSYSRYGPPSVVRVEEVPKPVPGRGEVLLRVHAGSVNTADWRMRAAAFPGILVIPGRAIYGLHKPRNPRLGTEFAGTVEDLGPGVTKFDLGDSLFGFKPSGGASAEFITVPQDSAVAKMPEHHSFEEAAALPFGGVCALVFLTDFARIEVGQNVLVVGASGGVGVYAVQIAKALGANVTGVSGPKSTALVHQLGADATIDYQATRMESVSARFDLILDTFGALSPRLARRLLVPGGLFLPLNFGLAELGAALLNPLRDRKIRIAVNGDKSEDLERLADLVQSGDVRPVIDTCYLLEDAARAHAHVETRNRRGAIILQIGDIDMNSKELN
ncbi:MAG: NAD(P)-dependent alcohol dehydrogenase [Pseudomonadota bacterium]